MNEELETTQSETDLTTQEDEAISLAEFLESVPPSQTRKIIDIAIITLVGRIYNYEMLTPEILIHCSACNGPRFFRF